MTSPSAAFGHSNSRERSFGMCPNFEYSHASDDELLAAARNSDGRAFAELYGRHAGSIKKTIFRILRNHEDTEDALQDAVYKAYMHLCCFRGACAFSTWLTRIAMNSALMMMRKKRLRCELACVRQTDEVQGWGVWEIPDQSLNAERAYAREEAFRSLSVAIEQLPPHYRKIFEQFHGTEKSLEEAASKLGIKVSTAKSRLVRARLRIRSCLEKRRISIGDFRH